MIWLKGFRICTVKESHFHLVIPQCTIILNKMSTAPVLYETKLLKKYDASNEILFGEKLFVNSVKYLFISMPIFINDSLFVLAAS